MIPSWMIENIERQRRERTDREAPRPTIELPVRTEEEPPRRRRDSSAPIVIELGAAPDDARGAPRRGATF